MGGIFQNTSYKKRPYIPKVKKREETIQRAVAAYIRRQYPHVIFRSDYSSGLNLTMNQAAIHKSLQSGRSCPDMFFFYWSRDHRDLHSFPTRRSSDLSRALLGPERSRRSSHRIRVSTPRESRRRSSGS